MPEKICYIIGASENGCIDFVPSSQDLVIAADGGYLSAIKADIKPDIIIGDFDSSPLPESNSGVEIVRLKPEKDYTDTAEAINTARQKGCDSFVIYGGLGGQRLSHTIANLALIVGLSKEHIPAVLIGEKLKVRAITDSLLKVAAGCKYLSVFAFDGEASVSLQGVKYPLAQYRLMPAVPLGISNEITASEATITAHKGTVLILEEF